MFSCFFYPTFCSCMFFPFHFLPLNNCPTFPVLLCNFPFRFLSLTRLFFPCIPHHPPFIPSHFLMLPGTQRKVIALRAVLKCDLLFHCFQYSLCQDSQAAPSGNRICHFRHHLSGFASPHSHRCYSQERSINYWMSKSLLLNHQLLTLATGSFILRVALFYSVLILQRGYRSH